MRKVVVSVDGSAASKAAVCWCVANLPSDAVVVAVCGMSLVSEFALSVSPLPSDSEQRIEDVFRNEWCQPLVGAGFEVRPKLVREDDADALVHAAAKERPDALIIGKMPHHALADFFAAGALHEVLHQMPCPILIVPAT
jgi:nucleotide-binding universal stress UspA family protein